MSCRPAVLSILLLFAAVFGRAQLNWHKVDAQFGPLPPSLHVYRSGDSLNGLPFTAWYVSARLKDKELLFGVETGQGRRFTLSQYFQLEQRPYVAVNCAFFSFATDENLSLIVKDGRMVASNIVALRGVGNDSLFYYYPTRGAIGIDRSRRADVAWTFTDTSRRWPYAFEDRPVVAKGRDSLPTIYHLKDIEWKWWKMRTAVGGGPVLICDGKIRITNREEQLFAGEEGAYDPRTAMGYTKDGRLIILAIQGRTPTAAGATLEEEARILLDLGCYEALNLDGGGSSCLLINGKETIRPSDKEGQRPIGAVFYIK